MRAVRKTPKALRALQSAKVKPTTRNALRRPQRAHVQWVVEDEADRAGEWPSDVFGRPWRSPILCARYRAIVRIMAESGCSIQGLADVWGLERKTIQRALSLATTNQRLDPYERRRVAGHPQAAQSPVDYGDKSLTPLNQRGKIAA